MANFTIGGIEATVEPTFKGFRAEVRRQLREEEARAPKVHVEVEPKVTQAAFRRELERIVKAAQTGVKVEVEVTPGLRGGVSGFKTELQRVVNAAQVGVNVEVPIVPVAHEHFRKLLSNVVRINSEGIYIEVEAKPVVKRGFKTLLKEQLKAATEGVSVTVNVLPDLGRRFRVELQQEARRATKLVKIEANIAPKLSKTFAKETKALATKALAKQYAYIDIRPRLARNFKSTLRALAKKNVTEFPVTIELKTERPREIRSKLIKAIREATEAPPLFARVRIVPIVGKLRGDVQREVKKVTSTAKPIEVDGRTSGSFRKTILSSVKATTTAASKLAKINIGLAKGSLSGISKGFAAIEGGLKRIRGLARLTATGLGYMTIAVAGAGSAGLKSAADFEFMRTNFGIFLNDAAKGEQVFQGLRKAAQESVFEVPDLSPLIQNLLVVSKLQPDILGFKEVLPTFQAITDFGALADLQGPALTRLGLAFAKISGRGVLTGEELRSISKNAPQLNAIGLIADRLGVTVPEAFEKIRAKEVSSAEALDILLEGIQKFPGAAGAGLQEVTTTFKGAFSNLPDILRGEFFDAFDKQLPRLTKLIAPGGPLVKAFSEGVHAMAEPFVGLATALGGLLEAGAPAIGAAFSTTVIIITELANALKPVMPVLEIFFRIIGDIVTKLAGPLQILGAVLGRQLLNALVIAYPAFIALGKVLEPIINAIARLVQFIAPLIPEFVSLAGAILAAVLPVLEALLPAFDKIGGPVILVMTALTEMISTLGPVIAQVIGPLAQGLAAIGQALLPILPVIGDTFSTIIATLAPALPVLGQVLGLLATAGVEFLSAFLPALAGVFAALIPAIKPIAAALVPVAEAAGVFFTAFGEGIAKLLPFLGELIASVGPLLVPMFEALAGVFPVLASALKVVLPAIQKLLKVLVGPLLLIFIQAFVAGLKAFALLIPPLGKLVDVLAPVIELILKAVRARAGDFALIIGVLAESFLKLFEALAPLLPVIINALVPIFTQMLKITAKIAPVVAELVTTFVDAFVPVIDDLVEALIPLIEEIMPIVLDVMENWFTAMLPLLPSLSELAVELMPVIVTALQTFVELLIIVTPLIILLAKAFGLVAAFQAKIIAFLVRLVVVVAGLAGAFLSAGSAIVGGFIRGLGGFVAAVTGFLGRAIGAILDFFRGLLGIHSPSSVFADFAHNIISGFIGGLGGFASSVLTKLGEVGLTILGWILGLPGKLVDAISGLAQVGLDMGGSILGGIKDAFTGAVGFAAEIGKKIFNGLAGLINRNVIDKIRDVSVFGGHPFGSFPHIPTLELAKGGIFDKPTLAVIGEDGPEVVIPLTDKQRMLELLQQAGVIASAQTALAGAVGQTARGGPGVGLSFAPDPEKGAAFTREAAASVEDLGAKLTGATTPGLDKWRTGVGTQFDRVIVGLDEFHRRSVTGMSQAMGNLRAVATTGSGAVVGALNTGLAAGTTAVASKVRSYAKALAGGLNPVLAAIGQPKINLGQFRKGGMNDPRIVPDGSYNVHVFGEKGTHGEAYIPFDPNLKSRSRAIADETVRRLGGQASWFRSGGVTGDTQGLHPEFMRRLDRWSNAVGRVYNVGSGYRSIDEQRRLYQNYLAGVPGQAKAAPPGTSMHNFGLASDGNHWGSLGPANFGLRYAVPGEPWHVEPNEARTWASLGDKGFAIVPLPKPTDTGNFGQLSITGKKAMQFTYLQALNWAGKQGLSGSGPTLNFSGAGGAREAMAAVWVRQAMGLTGVSGGNWLNGLLTLARRESNFDPRAVNLWDSNARNGFPTQGIGQMRMDTFLAHALPGHTNIFNPVDNLASVIRYIIERYFGIENVQQANASLPPKGYADGAIVSHEHMARVAERNKPEVIIPLTNPRRARYLAERSGVADMVRDEDGRVRYGGPRTIVEKVEVNVQPPAAASPSSYGSSVSHRVVPAVVDALTRAGL